MVRFGAQPPCLRSQRRRSFLLRRAFLQGRGERRIAGGTVDEFGGGAERDYHAPGRVTNRVRTVGAHLEPNFRFRRALDPAGGGRQKDFLCRLDRSRPGRTCPRAGDRPSRRRAAGIAGRNPPGIGPGPDQLREALGGIYALDFRRLPSGRGRGQGRFGGWRSGRRRGGLEGRRGAGGVAACCPAAGAGEGAGGGVGVGAGAGGAAASCAVGSTGAGGGDGAGSCATGEAAGGGGTGAGATAVGPGETGGVTFFWLPAVQPRWLPTPEESTRRVARIQMQGRERFRRRGAECTQRNEGRCGARTLHGRAPVSLHPCGPQLSFRDGSARRVLPNDTDLMTEALPSGTT